MHICLYVGMASDDGFRALGNGTRRTLLRLVRDRPRSVGELADAVGGSQPSTSQHLSVLRDAGLVSVTRDGRRRLYRARPTAIDELAAFFDDYWSGSLDRLAVAAERAGAECRSAS
jgi:DNA-binding transcriptional ArsR family regulator